jgi:hypothetical protein
VQQLVKRKIVTVPASTTNPSNMQTKTYLQAELIVSRVTA